MKTPKFNSNGWVSQVSPADEIEFYRRRNLPHIEVLYSQAGRSFDVSLYRFGQHLGTKTEVSKRGKVVSTTYLLPKLETP